MIKIDDFLKPGTPMGIAIGIGSTVLATVIIPALPVLAKAARPMAKAALKSGLLLAERGRELIAEVSEELEDVLAETKAELMRENTDSEAAGFDEVSTHQDDL